MPANRRVFMLRVAAAGSALATVASQAQPAKVSEKDPQAVALGYVEDTKRADSKKFPKHAPDQKCDNCQLFQGKPSDASGPCAIFGGKLVAGGGWCSAWTKKA
ncbi:iron permease [Ramlibacter sp. G-1-2-2]|uniref:High-potential iron-sulfur protein n=1 Tax=Ramlibacter agri TaxID=2728837 RepID=A0A848HF15_9BURK|nr:high-potential iron-sulfur protein [Ramlibacter agri]NML46188.1 iron permease [Ramlibacter agri]